METIRDAYIPTVTSFDGTPLVVREYGTAHTSVVVLVLPCGIRDAALQPWITAVAQKHRVLSLQTRFILDEVKTLENTDDISLNAQVEDVLAVVEHVGAPHVMLAGYCTGAKVALHALSRLGNRVRGAVLANGSYRLDAETVQTDYERDISQVLEACARNPRMARFMHSTLQQRGTLVREEVFRIHTGEAFRDLDTFIKYVKVTGKLYQSSLTDFAVVSNIPLLLLHGLADDMVAPAQSEAIARLTSGRLVQPVEDDHYAWCRPGTASLIQAQTFLDQCAASKDQ